ncbi:MAG: S8 family serine peptidase [Planctomycetia bacterium]
MKRPTCSRRASEASLGLETLEARTMMTADLLAAASRQIDQIEWNGRTAHTFADSWILRATSPQAATENLGLSAGWRATSLGEGFFSLSTPGATAQDVAGWAGRAAGVSYVEPDFAIAPSALPNDPSFSRLWGLHNIGQSGGVADADIDAPEAWDRTRGSRNVVVAVIDTGIDYSHPDLAANVWTNPGEVAGDGIDNDRNGYIDDVRGWDFANNDADPMDDNGHGTHVSGTIGAVGDNGVGVAGVNWQVSIMGLKFLSGSGSGSTSGAIAAINYATRMRRDFGINIVATNNSWGGGGFSAGLRDAIEAGGQAGILFVAAAGNDGRNNDATASYPASYTSQSIISVAATDRSNALATFSNFGATGVDLAAPGVGIYSTTPGNNYAAYSGTSMATPHVTGTVALMAAANPQATAGQLRTAILATAAPTASLAGKVATGGLLNAQAAVNAITSATLPTPAPTPAPAPAPAPVPPAADPGDTLARATTVPFTCETPRFASQTSGDGANGHRDVDLYRVTLAAGQQIAIDVDARSLANPSRLDSYLRLFNAGGRELARNDDAFGSYDSHLSFTARTAGTYFIGVSGYGNSTYWANNGTRAREGSTGGYEVTFTLSSLPARRASEMVRMLGFRDDDTSAQQRTARQAAFAAHAATTATTTTARPAARRITW